MTKSWYLVQADLEATASIITSTTCTGEYYCTFLAKHPSDTKLSDDCSRWWPDWYRYSRDSITNDIVFGDRTLFLPNITPSHKKFIQWGDTVSLSSHDCCLLVRFNFMPIDESNHTRNKVQFSWWHRLTEMCH